MTTVLVIEDNEQNLYLVTFLLEHRGYKVVQARTGGEGIERAQERPPSLVLLDIELPDRDGYSVATELRSQVGMSEIPIIAVTANAMLGDRDRGIRAGCSAYVEKPYEPDTLLAAVERFVGKPVA